MRIVFIGSVKFSYEALKTVLSIQDVVVVGFVTRRSSKFNADFVCLEGIAGEAGVPCLVLDGNDQATLHRWVTELNPDVIYCFGWSYLLGSEILTAAPLGVVGYHPAALPMNRGRHPIIWALALGLTETASTFFFLDEGVDSGDILSQVSVAIDPDDNATTLYEKLVEVAKGQIPEFTRALAQGTYSRVPQDHTKANYWRKRTKADGEIDWRMSARTIHNLVRALAHPYPGAHFVWRGREIKLWRSEVVPCTAANYEPGRVLKIDSSGILVKCGEDALRLVEHECTELPVEGSYL